DGLPPVAARHLEQAAQPVLLAGHELHVGENRDTVLPSQDCCDTIAARTRSPLSAAAATTDRLGRPLHDLRISVTDRCNFRCPYCMPAEIFGERYESLARPELLSFEEIARLARIFVGLGVEKLRITGGEPLLRHDLPRLIGVLARIEGLRDLTLTTNGFLLTAQ